jgi:hypothetical protein
MAKQTVSIVVNSRNQTLYFIHKDHIGKERVLTPKQWREYPLELINQGIAYSKMARNPGVSPEDALPKIKYELIQMDELAQQLMMQ